MCGIAGIVSTDSSDRTLGVAARRMTSLQAHRGPDGEGFYEAPGVALGHRRLAIIDLHDTGAQPMSDETGRWWLTFNGEIYNYIELRETLIAHGHRFRGTSDSEVLLAAFVEWGPALLSKLRGMFAFAIWDSAGRRLFAARDRLGIKPFHYWTDGSRLAFSSELKALLEFVPERRVRTTIAGQFLAWNLLEHEAAETMIEEIHRLPAGCSLSWGASGEMTIGRYWSLEVDDRLRAEVGERERAAQEFREQFQTSIALHLRSDVPVGSCLSGGLDSSAIVCVAGEQLQHGGNAGQHSFSAHFPGQAIDETEYIEEAARTAGCQMHFVIPTADDFLRDVETWIWHQEEPAGGTSAYAQYCVARLARQNGVKVLLDGQGADEQLAGYRKFIVVYLRQLLQAGHYAAAARNAVAFFGSREILRTIHFRSGARYLSGPSLLWDGQAPPRPEDLGLTGPLARRIEADLFRFSLPVLLRYEDRNTMAFGVESRVPFVDHVFVEWMATLPAELRLDGGWTKRVMRDALRGTLPEKIRLRKSKLGFSTPQEEWLRGPLGDWVSDVVSSSRHLLDLVERDRLMRLVAEFRRERGAAAGDLLCRLAIYDTWARRFVGR